MKYVIETLELTHTAVLEMLNAAIMAAEAMGQPQCIVIVDKSGETLASFRMTGAKYLSMLSARTKARTAASIRGDSSVIPAEVAPLIAAATQDQVTGLGGGLPIFVNGVLVGGIGVGSGSADQDIAVAKAAIAMLDSKCKSAPLR